MPTFPDTLNLNYSSAWAGFPSDAWYTKLAGGGYLPQTKPRGMSDIGYQQWLKDLDLVNKNPYSATNVTNFQPQQQYFLNPNYPADHPEQTQVLYRTKSPELQNLINTQVNALGQQQNRQQSIESAIEELINEFNKNIRPEVKAASAAETQFAKGIYSGDLENRLNTLLNAQSSALQSAANAAKNAATRAIGAAGTGMAGSGNSYLNAQANSVIGDILAKYNAEIAQQRTQLLGQWLPQFQSSMMGRTAAAAYQPLQYGLENLASAQKLRQAEQSQTANLLNSLINQWMANAFYGTYMPYQQPQVYYQPIYLPQQRPANNMVDLSGFINSLQPQRAINFSQLLSNYQNIPGFNGSSANDFLNQILNNYTGTGQYNGQYNDLSSLLGY